MWLAVIVCLAFILHQLMSVSMTLVARLESETGTMVMTGLLVSSLIIYAALIAIPFMPGIEVGLALLLLQGAAIAPFVYIATVTGLMTAYLIGAFIPVQWLRKFCHDCRMNRFADYLETIATTPPERRLVKQRALLPDWLAKITVDYRYVSIGVLLNVPGTFAIGGGGGILMAAGFSRLFNGWMILATLAVATLPVPLTVWIFGVSVFG